MVKLKGYGLLASKEYIFGGGSGLIIASIISDIFKIEIISMMVPCFFLGTAIYIFIFREALWYIHPNAFKRFSFVDFKRNPIVHAYGTEAIKIGVVHLIIGLLSLFLGQSFFSNIFRK